MRKSGILPAYPACQWLSPTSCQITALLKKTPQPSQEPEVMQYIGTSYKQAYLWVDYEIPVANLRDSGYDSLIFI